MEVLANLLNLSIMVFAVASMLSVGLSYTLKELVGPLRNVGGVLRVLIANFMLVPLLAYLILQLFPLDTPLAIGLFLVSSAAGAPFLIKLAEMSSGDVGISATMLVILLPATVLFLPFVVPLVLPEANVDAWTIARPLVLQMMLPLAIGLVVPQYAQEWAVRIKPWLGKITNVTLVLLIALSLITNLEGILGVFGTGAILAALLLIAGAFGIGFALGPRPESRDELGLATAQRNIAAASVVAVQAVGDLDVLSMIVVTSLAGFAVLLPVSSLLRKREEQRAASQVEHIDLKRE